VDIRAPGLVLSALPLATQDAAAQLAEKKVLNLAAPKKMVAATQTEAERNRRRGAPKWAALVKASRAKME
jgi:hypothetical protein